VSTEMASGNSGTASDSSNVDCTVGSFVGGPGTVEAIPCAALGASIGGAIAGTDK
jgi:hypothetical protein